MTLGDSRDEHLADLGRRLLSGEPIDWDKEGIAESEVREGMKRLQKIVGSPGGTETAVASPPSESKDRSIGPFRLVRKLGEGGMGVVYEAEQQRPHRGVALKVIRGGRHVDDHTLRLFQREIHTLARLNHPGIAQLYETGVTDDGMHYFAMELVRGVPLSEWLRKRSDGRVSPAELRIRLGVFRKICDAVAYAHQKGVIHRDLKPANILIPTTKAGSSIQDAVPEIKILDFGLARMTDTDVQMTTFHTEMGRVQGTLPYMSPEQIRGNPDEIDLRTDVYSLGVILYELVTGHLPLDVSKAQLGEAMRIICEESPRSLATTFQGTRRLDADIATIAGKCLEKETARRYQTAAALAEDVQRYLTDQPIQARPPSAAYQFRKLVHRHKGPFAVAIGAFVLLIAFSVAMSVLAFRISRERDRANKEAETARRVSEFLDGLFKAADPWAVGGKDVSPRDLLDRGALRLERELHDQPGVRARLMRSMGIVYRGIGEGEKGQSLFESARALAASTFGEESLEYADVLNELPGLENQQRAHDIRSRLLPPDDPRLARGLWHLGAAKLLLDMHDTEATLKRGLEILRKSSERDRLLELYFLNDLGLTLCKRGDYAEAVPFMEQAWTIRKEAYPRGHPDLINGGSGLGYSLMLAGQHRAARAPLEEAYAEARHFHPDSWLVAMSAHSLGELERLEGNRARARSLLMESLDYWERKEPDQPAIIESLTSLGRLEETEGRLGDAADHLERAHRIAAKGTGTSVLQPTADYVRVLRKLGRSADADAVEASESAKADR